MFCVAFVKTENNYNDLTRNNLMYMYTQLGSPRYKPARYVVSSIYDGLSQASDDPENTAKLCLVIIEGNVHIGLRDRLVEYLNHEYNQEVIVGHILDRGDEYYELHPQSFLVDLDWWKSVGRPEFRVDNIGEFETVEPIRSSENHHDNYTPLWVDSGTNTKTYSGTRPGWNWVQLALNGGNRISSFPKSIRDNKKFMYHRGPGKYENLQAVTHSFKAGHYCYNTEYFNKSDDDWDETDIVFAPAAGASPWLTAKNKNLRKGGKIVIYDVSYLALDITYKLQQRWNNQTYSEILEEILDELPSFSKQFLVAREPKHDSSQESAEFLEWYREYAHTFEYEFVYLDMYNWNELNRQIRRNSAEKVYFHCTNVYEYLCTAQLFDPLTRATFIDKVTDMFSSRNIKHNLSGISDRLRVAHAAFNPE